MRKQGLIINEILESRDMVLKSVKTRVYVRHNKWMLSYDKIVKKNGEALAIPVNPLNLKEVLEPEKAIKHLETALFNTPSP